MKTKLLCRRASCECGHDCSSKPRNVRGGGGGIRGGAVARSAPAVHAPMRPGGVSSFRSTPMRQLRQRTVLSRPTLFLVWNAFVTVLLDFGSLIYSNRVRSPVPVHTLQ